MLYISAGAILGMPREFSGWAPGRHLAATEPPARDMPLDICRRENSKMQMCLSPEERFAAGQFQRTRWPRGAVQKVIETI
jgi:hypothetical protein